MSGLFSMLFRSFAVLCVSLIIFQALFLGTFWISGAFSERNKTRIVAILQGTDLKQVISDEKAALLKMEQESKAIAPSQEMITRKKATSTKMDEIRLVENRLKVAQRRLQSVQDDFGRKLGLLETNAKENALTDLRNTIELLDSKVAKSVFVRLIDNGKMEDVVSVLRKMSRPKRQKLFAEFDREEDQQYIHDILTRLRQNDTEGTN